MIILSTWLLWTFRYIFLLTNRLQWFVSMPFHFFMRDIESNFSHAYFWVSIPLRITYSIVSYIILFPIRLINTLYFDFIIFLLTFLQNVIFDLFAPHYPDISVFKYILFWIIHLPLRIVISLWRIFLALIQSLLAVTSDLFFPRLTLFHGTNIDFAQNIAHEGKWLVGSGNYVGSGVYFAMNPDVAKHYGRNHHDKMAIVVARVMLFPCRPPASFSERIRNKIGNDGDFITKNMHLCRSMQHWRDNPKWHEFTILNPKCNEGKRFFRVRTICVTGKWLPKRVKNGISFWPGNLQGWLLSVCSLCLLLLLISGLTNLNIIPANYSSAINKIPGNVKRIISNNITKLLPAEKEKVAEYRKDDAKIHLVFVIKKWNILQFW